MYRQPAGRKRTSGHYRAGVTGKITFICIVYPLFPLDALIDPVGGIFADIVDASKYIACMRSCRVFETKHSRVSAVMS